MPFEQVVPYVFPAYPRDCGWPPTSIALNIQVAVGLAGRLAGWQANLGGGTVPDSYMSLVTAAIDPAFERHKGVVCAQFNPGANDSAYWFGDVLMLTGPLSDDAMGPFDCAVAVGEAYRVWIDDFYVAFETPATLGLSSKPVVYTPTDSTVEPVLTGVSNAQYGIRADGAGGFQFFSAIAGVQTEFVPIVWPAADLSDWVKITVEHQSATPAGAGQVRFFLNDNVVITRSFALATMPDLTNAPAAGGGAFMRRSVLGRAGDTDIFATMFRSRAGRFTVEGTELL